MIRRPPRSTHCISSAASDVYKRQVQGIITSLLDNPPNEQTVAVLEVDEANIVRIGKYLKADYVALTNIFRDQMDRFGEIYNILDKIIEGLNLMPEARIIANGDLPIFSYDKLKKFNPIYFAIRDDDHIGYDRDCLLYTSPSPRDISGSRMPSSA